MSCHHWRNLRVHLPCPGLDSFAALNVMEHMHELATLGHTVIASIHQPRSAIWDMFDKVCAHPEPEKEHLITFHGGVPSCGMKHKDNHSARHMVCVIECVRLLNTCFG